MIYDFILVYISNRYIIRQLDPRKYEKFSDITLRHIPSFL